MARASVASDAALGEVADELYGLAPAEFTAARNAAAKAAKANKQGDLAAAIAALPKPSTSAWIVNQLVRRHPDDVDALLELGEDLRAAEQARDADRIRSLSRERNLRVPALTRQAKALSEELGQPVSDAVETEINNTLTAALATPDFGAAVRSGRLTRALLWAGFGEMPALASLVAVPARTPKTRTKKADGAEAERAEAERAEAERAEAERAEAERAEAERLARELAEAQEAAAEADRRVEELTATVEDLTQRLDRTKRELAEARKEAKAAARLVKDLSLPGQPRYSAISSARSSPRREPPACCRREVRTPSSTPT